MSLTITHRERPAQLQPGGRTAIVLLHSRAADEHEVLPVLSDLDPDGQHLGLLPSGPFESTPEGHHWYSIEHEASPEPSSFLPSLETLSAWLDRTLAEHGIEPGRTVLGGFSQGAVMAYCLGLAPGRPSPAGILAFAGYIPRVEGFELDLADRSGVRVLIAHGTHDASIRVDFGREARQRLDRAGLVVRYHEDRAGHEISAGAVAQARAVLAEMLG